MAKIIFPANTTLFAGCFPDHLEYAKTWLKENGYSKDDVRIYKKEFSIPYKGDSKEHQGKIFKHTNLYVETIRPIAVECGVVECRNHQPKEKE